MTQKIFLLENKKKFILIFLILIAITIFISIFIYQKYNYDYFIQKIENSTGLEIKTNNDNNCVSSRHCQRHQKC